MTLELREAFSDYDDFRTWWSDVRNRLSATHVTEAVASCLQTGIVSPTFGSVPPSEISSRGTNHRETLRVRGLNSRQRAVLELLTEELGTYPQLRIYAPEAITTLAQFLRSKYPRFLGSEYAVTEDEREDLYPIPVEDIQALTLPTGSFDAVVTCDVLEHIPDVKAALREMHRIMAPGGVMLSTFPFTWKPDSRVQARLLDGELLHLTSPEYHGNPASPESGSLVFTVPGWEILEWARVAGFSRVEMIMMASGSLAIFGSDPPIINVLRCQKGESV